MTDDQIQALKDPGGSARGAFNQEERVVIHFTEQLTAWPAAIQQADLDALGKHFNAEQIAELVLIVCTANLTNRFNEGLRVPVDV